jgi:hypothetical protein
MILESGPKWSLVERRGRSTIKASLSSFTVHPFEQPRRAHASAWVPRNGHLARCVLSSGNGGKGDVSRQS